MIKINNISLIGRITKDPELESSQNGTNYCRFSIAINRAHDREKVDFINCVVFGKTSEILGKYVKKGHRLGVVGTLQMNKYKNNGETKTTYDVVVNSLDLLESKDKLGDFQKQVVDEFS